jgi:DNA-binding response OmpR family regulator
MEAAGHTVLEASNGAAGLKRFREDDPDLVITDIIMPEREGVETIMALRKESPGTPIIACSGGGGGGVDYLEIALKLGAQRVFPKPFSLNAIVAAVDELLGGTRPGKPGSTA